MTTTKSIISIGSACALVQSMPGRIREAAEQLGITPIMRINQVDHYDESDIEMIARFIRDHDAKN